MNHPVYSERIMVAIEWHETIALDDHVVQHIIALSYYIIL